MVISLGKKQWVLHNSRPGCQVCWHNRLKTVIANCHLADVGCLFLAYTPNWPVVLFLLLLHPPGTLYLLTFDCARTLCHYQTPLENPPVQTHSVLLCCLKRFCIVRLKGDIQICYYYYYPPFASIAKGEVFGLLYVCLFVCSSTISRQPAGRFTPYFACGRSLG